MEWACTLNYPSEHQLQICGPASVLRIPLHVPWESQGPSTLPAFGISRFKPPQEWLHFLGVSPKMFILRPSQSSGCLAVFQNPFPQILGSLQVSGFLPSFRVTPSEVFWGTQGCCILHTWGILLFLSVSTLPRISNPHFPNLMILLEFWGHPNPTSPPPKSPPQSP